MVIEKNYLHIAKDNGHLSGLNCFLRYPPPPAPPKVVPVATYTCVTTGEQTNVITHQTYYTSNVVTSTLTFFNDGTYQPNLLSSTGDWHISGNKILFTSGPYWMGTQHNVGILQSPGVPMPHAAYPLDPNTRYTLVIKDTRPEGGIPPSQEFTNYDGPPSTPYTGVLQSFYYCKKR